MHDNTNTDRATFKTEENRPTDFARAAPCSDPQDRQATQEAAEASRDIVGDLRAMLAEHERGAERRQAFLAEPTGRILDRIMSAVPGGSWRN